MVTIAEVAWAAGVYEGEGCISGGFSMVEARQRGLRWKGLS